MVESVEKKWYVLHTYAGYENKVSSNLESRAQSMGMEDNIFRVVVPEEESHEVKNGKDKVEMKKVFPGYVLVEMVMTDQAWYIVRNTPGVTGFLGSHGQGSKPTPLLPEEAENILHQLGMSARHTELNVEVGEQVTIIDGAFSGLTGEVTEIDTEKLKLKVNINMFGRETSTELDFDQVDQIV
ncbi:transcription termination/antitermination protein NusG [Lactiplantibacillus mudanjiangensis]|uniref:Transcription termination/antitermination protein NusG n=1 Tax=Lactiplantibacillus mudanjiangensis TaxID=1296538 RepID=A0A660DYF1_9LACO|nr:transcription termination/antitermination protein NusG [Lactiplantibacillus mudanjiangensis]VDG17998.1 transcription antitermination protein NusG [Lactobacillus plantarum JDM1] [Lactiplantibacillus mudanjiangensis]VDG24836.1 transcription antitermination protein NusG [Lactobacillus plantarum JDM1] [Lactiplantibacillus mudanjiangensis]VDG28417.1 transcription antitermination protein NusG [Lactobacillus plantarum JDM1] [Lactiplantibacillus mudanjiangensis]VDG32299.1 transcription antiterminati